MTVLANNFNGGTDGVTITTGNSGGLSGNALGHVSGAPVFSATQAHSPGLSARFPASSFTMIGYELAATTFWLRVYAWLPNHVAEGLIRLWDSADATGSYQGGINTKADGNLDLKCGAATVNVSGAIALNQWVRIEARFSTSSGAEVWLFNDADSSTPTATASTATTMSGTSNTQELTRLSGTTGLSYFDDFAVSDEGPIGPAVDPRARPALTAMTAVHRASRW
ncbi:hypothetical protein [Streptosporangium sp. G12]